MTWPAFSWTWPACYRSRFLGELAASVANGELSIPIVKRLPLAQAADAQSLAERGGSGGKVRIDM